MSRFTDDPSADMTAHLQTLGLDTLTDPVKLQESLAEWTQARGQWRLDSLLSEMGKLDSELATLEDETVSAAVTRRVLTREIVSLTQMVEGIVMAMESNDED